MRKFLVKQEKTYTVILCLMVFSFGPIATVAAVAIPFLRWLIITFYVILIVGFVGLIFLTKDWEWICPKCGFQPPWQRIGGGDASSMEQNRETNCERCGTEMTIIKKAKSSPSYRHDF